MASQRGEVRIEMNAAARPQRAPAREATPDEPFRILVLADLNGRRATDRRDAQGSDGRRSVPIDRDDFDAVMTRCEPRLKLRLGANGGTEVALAFATLDDFHPDALFRRVPVFARLRDLRDRLLDSRTSAAAMAECKGSIAGAASAAPVAESRAVAEDSQQFSGSLLESALQAAESGAAGGASDAGLLDRLAQELIAPFLLPRPDPRLADFVADVERAIGELMRSLLTAPAFRELEAAWRGLHLLTSRIETDRQLQIHVLDVSKDGLSAPPVDGIDSEASALAWQRIAGAIGVDGETPVALVVGAWSFADDVTDVALAERLAATCSRVGAAFVGAAAPGLYGCPGLSVGADPDDWGRPIERAVADAWAALRARPEAAGVGLVAPRFLLRLPYGQRSSPTTEFPFEEESPQCGHEELLWGNGAFLLALVIAEAFRDSGWRLQLQSHEEVAGLPLHIRRNDGDSVVVPVAEVELTSVGAERMGRHGVMPLFSVRGSDAVRFGSFRSIAASGGPLVGRWRLA